MSTLKVTKKIAACLLSISMIGGLNAGVASASSFSVGTSMKVHNWNETANYSFDAHVNNSSAKRIRFITSGSCAVTAAMVQYQLHVAYTNKVMADTQYFQVGSTVRPWWNADAGRYHVDVLAYNNNDTPSSTKPVYLSPFTFQNF